ncbi:hypothetical protein LTR66_002403 [Elasticomyces elasticus]|nr:hypothetical protein LTR66_002403 [Elasticomyces elasticus]
MASSRQGCDRVGFVRGPSATSKDHRDPGAHRDFLHLVKCSRGYDIVIDSLYTIVNHIHPVSAWPIACDMRAKFGESAIIRAIERASSFDEVEGKCQMNSDMIQPFIEEGARAYAECLRDNDLADVKIEFLCDRNNDGYTRSQIQKTSQLGGIHYSMDQWDAKTGSSSCYVVLKNDVLKEYVSQQVKNGIEISVTTNSHPAPIPVVIPAPVQPKVRLEDRYPIDRESSSLKEHLLGPDHAKVRRNRDWDVFRSTRKVVIKPNPNIAGPQRMEDIAPSLTDDHWWRNDFIAREQQLRSYWREHREWEAAQSRRARQTSTTSRSDTPELDGDTTASTSPELLVEPPTVLGRVLKGKAILKDAAVLIENIIKPGNDVGHCTRRVESEDCQGEEAAANQSPLTEESSPSTSASKSFPKLTDRLPYAFRTEDAITTDEQRSIVLEAEKAHDKAIGLRMHKRADSEATQLDFLLTRDEVLDKTLRNIKDFTEAYMKHPDDKENVNNLQYTIRFSNYHTNIFNRMRTDLLLNLKHPALGGREDLLHEQRRIVAKRLGWKSGFVVPAARSLYDMPEPPPCANLGAATAPSDTGPTFAVGTPHPDTGMEAVHPDEGVAFVLFSSTDLHDGPAACQDLGARFAPLFDHVA